MFSLRLYQRYLMRETLAAIFLVLVAFLALFSFFDLINELRSVGKNGYQLGHAVAFVALNLPGLVYELIPIAALIGTLYALSTLARHSEITVLRASGLATRDLLLTLFRVAGLLALLTVIVGEGLVPVSERLAQELRMRAMSSVIAQQGFESGLWVKDGHSFINIRHATPGHGSRPPWGRRRAAPPRDLPPYAGEVRATPIGWRIRRAGASSQ